MILSDLFDLSEKRLVVRDDLSLKISLIFLSVVKSEEYEDVKQSKCFRSSIFFVTPKIVTDRG